MCQTERLVLHAAIECRKWDKLLTLTKQITGATKLLLKNNVIPSSPGYFGRGPAVTCFAAVPAPIIPVAAVSVVSGQN